MNAECGMMNEEMKDESCLPSASHLTVSRVLLLCCIAFACVTEAFAGARPATGGAVSFASLTAAQSKGRSRSSTRRRSTQRRKVAQARKPTRRPDVIFVPTPTETVEEMLRLAQLKEGDVLYDLGSGDGRIPIMAAQRHAGVRAVGIEIDPELIKVAEEGARHAGVSDRVSFRQEDLFRADFREATVVTLYLSDRLNVLLRPKLLRELRPGTRIISHDFRMGVWKPEQTVRVPWKSLYRTVYVWTVPRGGRIK
jgi:SAM-dependent methyltransferase